MDPNMAYAFRTALVQTGADFEVVRKRILLKAAEVAGCTLDKATLAGHVGVVFVEEDPVQSTKALFKFRKENEGVLEIIGGRFEGRICSAVDVELIANLPGKEEMRAQFLGLLEAVPAQTLGVMDALLTSVVYCLDNKSKI
jgi:large subunit ribosomal protein L10